MPKIKSFEEACKAKKLNPKHLPEVSMLPERHQKAIISLYKLIIITEALNEEWEPDWNDNSQWKYYPWFYMNGGSGVSYHGSDCGDAGSNVGSRLVFKSSALAEYAATTFQPLYNDFFVVSK